jgi:hypothetical protein
MPTQLLDRDDLFTLTQAAKRLPGRPHRSTLWRWHRQGYRLADGSRIHLRVTRLGRRTLVSPEDLAEFAERITEAEQRPQPHPTRQRAEGPGRGSNRHERAEREADELGI